MQLSHCQTLCDNHKKHWSNCLMLILCYLFLPLLCMTTLQSLICGTLCYLFLPFLCMTTLQCLSAVFCVLYVTFHTRHIDFLHHVQFVLWTDTPLHIFLPNNFTGLLFSSQNIRHPDLFRPSNLPNRLFPHQINFILP